MIETLRYFVVPATNAFFYQAKANVSTFSVMITWIFTPVIFGSVAALLYKSLDADPLVVHAVLGTIVVGSWSTALFLATNTIGNDRWSGVLELTLATPARSSGIMAGKLLASGLQGLLAAAIAVFGVSVMSQTLVHVERPLLLVASLPFVLLGIASFALMFSTLMFITRTGLFGLFAVLDTGLMFVSAVLYPLSVLPGWLQIISRLSPLRWCAEALVASAGADRPASDTFEAWAAITGLAVMYGATGIVAYEILDRRLRQTGELATF